MKLRLILLIIFITNYNLINAQVNKETFEKAVDILNCKTIELSLYKSPTKGVKKKFQKKCNCQNPPSYDIMLSAIEKSEKETMSLASEIESIKKNEYNSDLESNEIVNMLSIDIFSKVDQYENLAKFAEARKKDDSFSTYSDDIRNGVTSLLSKQNQIEVKQTNKKSDKGVIASLSERVSEIERNLKNINKKNGWFGGVTFQIDIISILISMFLAIALVYLLFRGLINRNQEIPDNIRNYIKQKIKEEKLSIINNKPIQHNNDNRDLYNRIEYLEKHINIITNKIDSLVSTNQTNASTTRLETPETEQILPKSEVLYLSTPNSDGSFNDSSASLNYKEGASIYRFTKIANNRVNFQIDERDASVKLALQYPDKNIDPVCDAENAFNPKAKTIITIEVGEAELVGDKWIRNNKAKIRYGN